MGRKSRHKKEKKERPVEDVIADPVKKETRKFLKAHGLAAGGDAEEKGSRLTFLVSMIVNFMIYRFIKAGIQLPSVSHEEEQRDELRLQGLNASLENVCTELGIVPYEVSDLVSVLARDETLVGQVMGKNYTILELLVPSEAFREMTDGQIENPDTWGDSLSEYASRKEDYFEALKEIFLLNLAVVRTGSDADASGPDFEGGLAEIKNKYHLNTDDLEKLRRRGTEFFMAAFAQYLEMDFQRVRKAIDGNVYNSEEQPGSPMS
jgi:hypothetical protein